MKVEKHHSSRLTTRRTYSKGLLVSLALLGLLLAACGEITPTGQEDQLLINEVFTGASSGGTQWIELINNTNEAMNLSNYRLDTRYGALNLGELTAASPGKGVLGKGATIVFANNPQLLQDNVYKLDQDAARDDTARANVKKPPLAIQETKILGKLDPTKDLLVLKSANGGTLVDQVGWGNPDQAVRTQLLGGSTSDINLNLPAPAFDTKSLGRTPYFGQRDPTDPGEINPGIFTLHNTPIPGRNTTPRAVNTYSFFFTSFTDAAATVGAALLWLAFFIIALVARRFETLSEQKTYWQFLMAAPAGILIYAILQVQDFIRTGRLTDFWSWPAFLALFVSGIACVYVINIFRLIAKNILEAE